MSTGPRAAILHGATMDRPDERDTLEQAALVARCLGTLGWRTETVALGLDLSALDRLLSPRPAVVFNLVEAIAGDGRLAPLAPAVLEHLGIPCTGTSAAALGVTTAKPASKTMLRAAGLPTPDWIAGGVATTAAADCDRMIVKSVSEDASIGIDADSVVPAAAAAAEIARRRARFGGEWFAEAYIDGREFNVGLLDGPDGTVVLPITEIEFLDYPDDRPRIVDYEAKWIGDSFAFSHTPRRFDLPPGDASLLEELAALARRTFALFGLAGYARVDFRVDAQGRPWILEVNANPCLSEDAGFAAAAARGGLTMEQVVGRIVDAAIGREARTAA